MNVPNVLYASDNPDYLDSGDGKIRFAVFCSSMFKSSDGLIEFRF